MNCTDCAWFSEIERRATRGDLCESCAQARDRAILAGTMDVDYDNDLDVPVTIGRNREITRGGFMTLMHALHSEFPLDQNTHYEVLRVALNLKGADDA